MRECFSQRAISERKILPSATKHTSMLLQQGLFQLMSDLKLSEEQAITCHVVLSKTRKSRQ